jgi:hypothetical protein
MQTETFYILGQRLGLTKMDIDLLLQQELISNEHPTLWLGPPFYQGGSRYGTFSPQILLNNANEPRKNNTRPR